MSHSIDVRHVLRALTNCHSDINAQPHKIVNPTDVNQPHVFSIFKNYTKLPSIVPNCFQFSKRTDKPRNTTLLSSAVVDSVTANDSVTLNCSTDANPPAHVFSLYHEGSVITQNASFTIERVTWSDQGEYTCVPSNILGEGENASIALTVFGKFH